MNVTQSVHAQLRMCTSLAARPPDDQIQGEIP